jgi:hypothetical protein
MKKTEKNEMKNNKLGLVPTIPIPHTDFYGVIDINGVKIPCAVLYPESENPIRVFIQREVVGLLTGNKKGGFDRYLKPKNLQKYVPEKFKDKSFSETTITFTIGANSRKAQGFVGVDIIDICKMYMQADKKDELLPNQKHLAVQSEVIVFAFAKTGVDALIDEATGFEKVRPRYALNNQLRKYIAEELRPYIPIFPDKFYKLIFKLNGWAFDDDSIKKRPGIVGKWTNEIIYSRFPKGVFGKIKEINQRLPSGQLKHKNHEFLSETEGLKALEEFLSNAMFLMESCANWAKFKRAFARATGQEYQGDMFED